MAEDGKSHCRIEMFGAAPIGTHAMPPRRTLAKLPHGRAVRYTYEAGHPVQDRVLGAPMVFSASCDAVAASSAVHTCHPVKCAFPALVNTEHPHGEVLHGETATCVDGKRQITPPAGRTAKAHPWESASLSLAGNRFFITRVLKSSGRMGMPRWFRFGRHLRKHVFRGCCF